MMLVIIKVMLLFILFPLFFIIANTIAEIIVCFTEGFGETFEASAFFNAMFDFTEKAKEYGRGIGAKGRVA